MYIGKVVYVPILPIVAYIRGRCPVLCHIVAKIIAPTAFAQGNNF